MTKHARKSARAGAPCACVPWCGQYVQQPDGAGRPGKWAPGHKPSRGGDAPLCSCGCGHPVVRNGAKGRWPKYLEGHDG